MKLALVQMCNAGDIQGKAADKEQIIYADIDPDEAGIIRTGRPYTNLRRTDTYR